MVFSSLIFLFLFLVLNLTIYLFVKDKYKNIDELMLAIDDYINYYNYDKIKRIVSCELQVTIL